MSVKCHIKCQLMRCLSTAVSELDTRAEGEREEEGTDGKAHLKRMGDAITEVKDALVAEVDNMEERVCSASLQVKVRVGGVALWVETGGVALWVETEY